MIAGLPGKGLTARGARLRKTAAAATACVAVALLCACGSDGDDPAPAQPATGQQPPTGSQPAGNRAPTIGGSPQGTILVGQPYNFAPTAADADNNTLTFTITNKPAWASFDTATGKLTGTPTGADVRTYSNIRISVSDGTASANLNPFEIQVTAVATGTATLSWTPPTQNTDGSALTNLNGYKVYWGTSQGNYANSASVGMGIANYVVEQLTPGTWYFTVTAINSQGVESAYSNVASKTI
jgi:hypothetical protein